MILLILGVLLWTVAHLMPALAPAFRRGLLEKLGEKTYRGIFSLVIVASLVLIVMGWRSTPEELVYELPGVTRPVGLILMLLAFALIGAAHRATMIKRLIRHPMLTGVFLWACSHLLTNGTTRALILFGALGLWALIEIPLISRREGAYAKPDAPGSTEELKGLLISAIIFIVALFLHPYFAGVSPIPG